MNVTIAISTVDDGNMLIRSDKSNQEVIQNRTKFLSAHDINIHDTTRVSVAYGGDNYRRYHEVSPFQKGAGMFDSGTVVSDALITLTPNHALFLPLADCVGTAIFDPEKQILMLSHLGRHSLEQNGGYESIQFLVNHYNCNPGKLLVWLTPAPGQENYPVHTFDNRSMKSVVFEQLNSAGILSSNITDDPTDTTTDSRYYSHSEFLKGHQTEDGRFAIVAMMKG